MNDPEILKGRELSPEEKDLATLFRLSYRYSQGGAVIQDLFFKWLIQHAYINPASLPDKIPDFLASITPPKQHTATSPTGIIDDLRRQWTKLKTLDTSTYTSTYDESENLEAIAHNFIGRDLNYIGNTVLSIRPGRTPNGIVLPDSSSDPYASFTRKYVLQQHPAGHEAFNIMFGQVNDVISQFRPEDDPMQTLRRLEVSWEKHHPGESFYTPAPSITPTPLLRGV